MYIPLNQQRDYMYSTWAFKRRQFQQQMLSALIYCDQCGARGDYIRIQKFDNSELGQIRHSCGGYLQFSESTTLSQYHKGLPPEQQAILDEEIAHRIACTISERLKEDEDHIKASCYVLDLLHRNPIQKHSGIQRQYGSPQIDPLNFPDRFPSCPYCKSKWIGPKPRLASVFGIPVPKWVYPTPEPPQFCFKCRQIVP